MLRACDDGIPVKCIEDPLRISVRRDHSPPVFDQLGQYVFTINDTALVGSLVGQVHAVDNEPIVSIQLK